jgi:hypothetical protein
MVLAVFILFGKEQLKEVSKSQKKLEKDQKFSSFIAALLSASVTQHFSLSVCTVFVFSACLSVLVFLCL